LLTAVLLIVKLFLKPITDLTHIITATVVGAARDNPTGSLAAETR